MRQALARARAWWSESPAEIPKALSPAVRRGGEGGGRGLAKVRTSVHKADLLTAISPPRRRGGEGETRWTTFLELRWVRRWRRPRGVVRESRRERESRLRCGPPRGRGWGEGAREGTDLG